MAGVQTFAYEDVTVGSTAVTLTAATYGAADYASMLVEGGPIRFRLDSGTPTASVGDLLNVGDRLVLESDSEIQGFKAIRVDGSSATLRVNYGKQR